MLNAYQAYARTAKTGLTGRPLLAAILQQCAIDLQRAADAGPQGDGFVDALERNRRAWSVIAEEISDPESPLEQEVRQSLGRIATFMFRETFQICEEPDAGRLAPLAQVNRTLATSFDKPLRP
jgi:flagellar biosynthesis regulator FlaF